MHLIISRNIYKHVKLNILLSTVIHLTNIYNFYKAINGSTEEMNRQHFSKRLSEMHSLFLGKLPKEELAVAVPVLFVNRRWTGAHISAGVPAGLQWVVAKT